MFCVILSMVKFIFGSIRFNGEMCVYGYLTNVMILNEFASAIL